MKVHYKGHEISVERDGSPYRPQEGLCYIYWSVYRIEDGYCCDESYSYSCETVREFVAVLKERIDNELATSDPWLERASAVARELKGD